MLDAALVLADAIEEGRDFDVDDSTRKLARDVLDAAVGQYLHDTRHAPERRPGGVSSRKWTAALGFAFATNEARDRAAICLFCRADVNGLPRDRGGERQIPAGWLATITKHTTPCAIRWLAAWAPRGPRGVRLPRQTTGRK